MLIYIKNLKKKFSTSKNVVSILHNYYFELIFGSSLFVVKFLTCGHNNKLFFIFRYYTYNMAIRILDKKKCIK